VKIALVILHADPARGGAERYTHDLAAALAKSGDQVALLASSIREPPHGVRCVQLPAPGWTRVSQYGAFARSLKRHLSETEYDIVHAMLPVARCNVYHPHAGLAVAALASWTNKLKAIVNPRRLTFASVERRLLTSSNPPIILALSEYVRRSIRRYYPLPDQKLRVLFNAVDLKRFEPPSHRPARGFVNALFIGQDFQRKGLAQVLEAMRLLPDARLRLTIVGRGEVPREARSDGRVSYVGVVSNPLPYYRDADLLVLPTRHDPCSLVVLEALAMGVPVLSTKVNGACEVMTDGVHGFVLDDPWDVQTLASRMRDMLDDKRRAAMASACLALRESLSYEHHLETLRNIYEDVASRKRVAVG
jgi:UDP-glucose:(heptosyl)LPS alpha-1,3-glucosyltransferase